MEKQNIWVMRWAFDPPHKWHLDLVVSSFKDLALSKLIVVVKFIWEKDIATSIDQRINMMRIQLSWYDLPVDVLRQNIQWHRQELTALRESYNSPIINICWSDKSKRELEVYWRRWDIFWINLRDGYWIDATNETARKMGINIVKLNTNPNYCTSSTYIRERLLHWIIYQDWLDEWVSWYIKQNWLYLPCNQLVNKEEFILRWFLFLDTLITIFPELKLLNIEPPDFNSIQSKQAWREKYIRTIVKARKLRWDLLVRFVLEAEKINIKTW